ncbi:MAG TPA: hypothetical protein V6C78_29510 [Crinalium sp.]|jgi:hypothetical protein
MPFGQIERECLDDDLWALHHTRQIAFSHHPDQAEHSSQNNALPEFSASVDWWIGVRGVIAFFASVRRVSVKQENIKAADR